MVAAQPIQTKQLEFASAQQQEAFEWGPTPLCLSGGFGAAKTYSAILKALYLSAVFPGNRGVIARKVWDELKKTTMVTFFKLCPPQAYMPYGRRADSEKILRFNNGSEILWLHLDDPNTETVIRGLEINWFLIDQAEEVEEELFDMMVGRLGRWDQVQIPPEMVTDDWSFFTQEGEPTVPTYPILTCNPDHKLHWIYRRFHPESKEKYLQRITGRKDDEGNPIYESYADQGYHMIEMESSSNRFLPKHNLDSMLRRGAAYVDRFVKGKWGITQGIIHEQFNQDHIIPGSDEVLAWILENCTLARTLDYGDSAPTCCIWWATDRQGRSYAYREYYQPGMVSYHRTNIKNMSPDRERYGMQLADPSIFAKTQQKQGGRWSIADEYCDISVLDPSTAIYWSPADNNEMMCRSRISEYLVPDERLDFPPFHPRAGEKGSPRLFFIERNTMYPYGCQHAIEETKNQRRIKIGTDMGEPVYSDERDDKVPDHAYDNVRYYVGSRPPIAVAPARKLPRNSFKAVMLDMHKRRRAGEDKKLARLAKLRGYGYRG
jgi:hypothetical protein